MFTCPTSEITSPGRRAIGFDQPWVAGSNFKNDPEFQIRGGIKVNSKIIFLIS